MEAFWKYVNKLNEQQIIFLRHGKISLDNKHKSGFGSSFTSKVSTVPVRILKSAPRTSETKTKLFKPIILYDLTRMSIASH